MSAEIQFPKLPITPSYSGVSNNLDILRSVAVLSVVFSHLAKYLPHRIADPIYHIITSGGIHNIGVGGVLFFFVHTCLVLLHSLDRTHSRNTTINFYIRRVFRIFPLVWICIVMILLTGVTDVSWVIIRDMGTAGIVANLLLIQNILKFPNILGPLWSLPWELQMYLMIPFVYFLSKRWCNPLLGIGLWVIPLFLRVFLDWAGIHSNSIIYPSFFLGGLIAYQLRPVLRPRLPSLAWPLVIFSLVTIRIIVLEGDSFNSIHNVTVNALTCLVLGLSIPLFHEVSTGWLTQPTKRITQYSFGIYLFHVPAIVIAFGSALDASFPMRFFLFVMITTALAVGFYHLLEAPAIRIGRKLASRLS